MHRHAHKFVVSVPDWFFDPVHWELSGVVVSVSPVGSAAVVAHFATVNDDNEVTLSVAFETDDDVSSSVDAEHGFGDDDFSFSSSSVFSPSPVSDFFFSVDSSSADFFFSSAGAFACRSFLR